MNEVHDEFWKLVRSAKEEWTRTYGVNEIECHLLKILRFVKRHPKEKSELSDYFISLLQDGRSSMEIVQFCMRELQWLEVKEAAVQMQKELKDIRRLDILDRILEVYQEDWEDKDLYEYYTSGSVNDCP